MACAGMRIYTLSHYVFFSSNVVGLFQRLRRPTCGGPLSIVICFWKVLSKSKGGVFSVDIRRLCLMNGNYKFSLMHNSMVQMLIRKLVLS
jgi:hypothetical protein